MEPVPHIVLGQPVDATKIALAKQFRREMTPAERLLWDHLRGNRLAGFHFRRQQLIEGFIVDFYCHSSAVIVEVDGPVHDRQAEYDAERDRILGERGFRILRFTNEEVTKSVQEVLRKIEGDCRREPQT